MGIGTVFFEILNIFYLGYFAVLFLMHAIDIYDIYFKIYTFPMILMIVFIGSEKPLCLLIQEATYNISNHHIMPFLQELK